MTDVDKLKSVGWILLGVTVVYIVIAIFMTFLGGVAADTAVTMNATSNMSNYPGALEILQASPWILWFVPGAVGLIWIVIILRKPSE